MSNEELLKMYEAIKADPGELVRAAARKRLINFARYMQPDLVLEPFHVVYYTLLDMFAHGKIRKMIVQQPPLTVFHDSASQFILVKPVQPINTSFPMLHTLSGIVISVKVVQ